MLEIPVHCIVKGEKIKVQRYLLNTSSALVAFTYIPNLDSFGAPIVSLLIIHSPHSALLFHLI